MGELVSFGRLCVGNLAEELWGNGTVKDEISIEELDFLDRFPPSHRSRARCSPHDSWIILKFWLCTRIWSVRIVRGQYRYGIIILLILIVLSWVWI